MDQLAKIKQYEHIDSFLFQIEGANYSNFEQMENYLQNCDKALEARVGDLQSKMEIIREELVRTAGVYHLNNKKRQKEAQLLEIERDKIKKNMEAHKERLNVTIHPITLVLKEKQSQIVRLNQTREIIQDFQRITQGKEEDMLRTLPLDDKNFNDSALKIYVFKCLFEDMDNPEYTNAKNFIKRKFIDLKSKIISNFKEGFIKKDIILVNYFLPYCEEYELLDEISDYYNQEAFKESHKLHKVEADSVDSQIKNLFFLLKRGFAYAFSSQVNGVEKNHHKISNILSKHEEFISRRLIIFAFERIIKESIDNVLKHLEIPADYLHALELFSTECRSLLTSCEEIVSDDKVLHLIQTYIDSIFDTYLDNYLYKELNNLTRLYEQNIGNIVEQLKAVQALQEGEMVKRENKKFSFKRLMDYKIESKKVYNVEYVREKLQALSNVFMDPSLQGLFNATKKALNRNAKISKINEVDKNMNQILAVFIRQIGQLVNTIILSMKDVIPGFQDNAPPLEHQFFQVIPQINILLQRMEFVYGQYRKQARYELSESIKLEQKKEDLILQCEKNLNKIVADALACILTSEKAILKSRSAYSQAQTQAEGVSQHLYMMLQKYIKTINRISQLIYKETLIKTLGLQFVNMLVNHYASIAYTRDGLGAIYVDLGGYSKILKLLNNPAVQEKFRVFKSLIDIYILKNDEKEISNYIKAEKESTMRNEKEDVIRMYVQNKQRVEKGWK